MVEVKKVTRTAEQGGIANVAPAAPEPPITITEVKPPGVIHGVDQLEKAGDMTVEEFKPTDADLQRLAQAQASVVPGQAQPAPDVSPPRVELVSASVAKRTMAEMERGRQIVEAKTAFREKMLAVGG